MAAGRNDILAVGESLIDFVSEVRDGKVHFIGSAGGAPANVLAMAATLGWQTAMVARLGKDTCGDFLLAYMQNAGVGTQFVSFDELRPTTLAVVSLDESGNRSFSFYRGETADVQLAEEDIPLAAVAAARILHFGSVSLTQQPARAATLKAARHAKASGVAVSYDPNLRPLLWPSLEEARDEILKGLELADYVKLSDEELVFLTGENDLEKGIEAVYAKYAPALLAVTMGPAGCYCRVASGLYRAFTFDTDCVDTTGSGDAFWGACLAWVLESGRPPAAYTEADVTALMDFCNAAGSLAATEKGANPAVLTRQNILGCIETVPRLVV